VFFVNKAKLYSRQFKDRHIHAKKGLRC